MKKRSNSEAGLLEMINDLKVQQIELESQNKELIHAREEAAKALTIQNNLMSKLNQFSLELSLMSSDEDLEVLIARRLKDLSGSMMTTFASYNSDTHLLTARHVELEPGILEKAINLLGMSWPKMQVHVSDEHYHIMSSEILGMRKTVYEASFGAIPRPVAAAIQALLKVDRFLGAAYLVEGKLYGTSIIAMSKNQPDPQKEILMDFISMASLALRRKRADETLRESEEMYQTFINSTEDMAYLKDSNLRYVIINKANCDFFGKKHEQIIGLTDLELMDPTSAGYCMQTDKEALVESKIIIREERVGNRIYETRKFPVKLKSGVIGVGGYVRDITERKAADEALKSSEDRYKRITEGLTDYLYTVKIKNGAVVETIHNEACKTVTGYSPEDFYKDPFLWINMVIPEDRELVAGRFSKILKGEDLPTLEHRIICKNGKIRWISDMIIPKYDRNRVLVSYDGVIKEITDRKQAEEIIKIKNEELIRVNTEKDKFFSVIAHDLRSPFNAFLGFTEMMAEELDTLSITEIQKIAVSMRNSATNLFQLLENLLEWSRFQRGLISFVPESVLLLPGILETLHPVFESANKKEIHIALDIPDNLVVFADRTLLGSIIRNLAFNAVKFTCRGGMISISGKVSGDFAEVSVKDTGIGMSNEMLDNLFRIDANTRRSGTDGELSTGLGLILCREFVEKHNGKLRVESQEGKGSEFSFTLPLFHRRGN